MSTGKESAALSAKTERLESVESLHKRRGPRATCLPLSSDDRRPRRPQPFPRRWYPPSGCAEHSARPLSRIEFAMIILDDDEEQLPKLASPPPHYETSQKLHRLGIWKRKATSRRWRWAIYGLIAYFVITVAIGVPLIVVKTRKNSTTYKNPSLLYPSPAYGASNSSIPGFDLGTGPLCVDDATACDVWDFKDRKSGGLLHAQLEYYIPVTDTVFVQSNVSYPSNMTSPPISGSLTVNLSDDPKDTNASITVAMSYTGSDVREKTSVCLMNVAGADGLYLFVPEELYDPDKLHFNVTVLLPKHNGTSSSVYISSFITELPYFSQNIGGLSPRVTFGSVAIGGDKSNVTLAAVQAEEIYVKASLANINGPVNSTDDQVLSYPPHINHV
ncbi:hypothetical protein NM688_g2595 [Phlebia brevispora]|uniref:Uncharacterized protein n=1 Tax=Phlebia brevispora TaxID=194682 RepID=A0ACC1T7X3_9APHY|nr:hypothetical protein NM688_g2595 [Phlebia brevispora]